MPVFVDTSEMRTGTRMPEIPDAIKCDNLESITGADFMVSTKTQKPRAMAQYELHAKSGAIFVQRKSGSDLINSVGERLNTSLAKMWTIKNKYAGQRVLLITGIFVPDEYGNAIVGDVVNTRGKFPYIQWQKSGLKYDSLLGALNAWTFRGGVNMISLPNDKSIIQWTKVAEKKLLSMEGEKFKDIIQSVNFPDDEPIENDPLQLPRRVTDFRRALATFPGIGSKKAKQLWEFTKRNPISCIQILTGNDDFHGIGATTVSNCRNYMGMFEGTEIGEFYPGDLVSPDFSVEK